MAANRRIKLRSTYATSDEGRASGAIQPGSRIQIGADGRVAANATAAPVTPCRIAEEDALQGRTVDDPYAAGDLVFYSYPLPGDHYNILLANGQNAAIGSILVPNNAGAHTVKAAETTGLEWQALEALNNTSGSAQLIRAVKL